MSPPRIKEMYSIVGLIILSSYPRPLETRRKQTERNPQGDSKAAHSLLHMLNRQQISANQVV